MQRTAKIIEIDAPVERVFDLFSDFESFPRWMSHIKEVRYTGRRYTRWTAEAPLGSSVEWEAETVVFEPDQRIAWRSVRGDVLTEGEVDFHETARGTTLLRVILGYDPPAGRLGALVARLFGTNPEEQLEEDLERFALVAEAPRQARRPPARNRDMDNRERRINRRRLEPSGMYDDDAHARKRRRREAYYPDERAPMRERFDRESREAPRSQRESMQRYDEDRRRDDHSGRHRPEEFVREERSLKRRERGPADERRLYEARMRERASEDEDDARRDHRRSSSSVPPARHALTPRERELESGVRPRRLDSDYSRKAFGRGVDKLLDEDDAPSSRWRRR